MQKMLLHDESKLDTDDATATATATTNPAEIDIAPISRRPSLENIQLSIEDVKSTDEIITREPEIKKEEEVTLDFESL